MIMTCLLITALEAEDEFALRKKADEKEQHEEICCSQDLTHNEIQWANWTMDQSCARYRQPQEVSLEKLGPLP